MKTPAYTSYEQALALIPWEEGNKAIILVDLDAFFASVEQLDHPEWRGEPVIVGGSPESRGVVSTASYEARKFGVHSAMASAQAKRLCPHAHWTEGNYPRYKEISGQVMAILHATTPLVQQVSIDEAFADITPSTAFPVHPAVTAARIQEEVAKLGVTCSIGLATSKALAKIASEKDKPRGLCVVYPGTEADFVKDLPTSALNGIGGATKERLRKAGIVTLGDVYAADEARLTSLLGKMGTTVYERLHGSDPVEYEPTMAKSVSHDVTFPKDLRTHADAQRETLVILSEVCRRVRKLGKYATTLTVKVHYDAVSSKSAQMKLSSPCADEYRLKEPACELLKTLVVDGMSVRLISVGLSGLVDTANDQEQLLNREDSFAKDTAALVEAKDAIRARFGKSAVKSGRAVIGLSGESLRDPEN